MKSALTVVLFRLFTIGVFVDGKETSNMESVSVTEGDSVTLKSGFTEVQTDDEIEWKFSGSKIATISIESSEISLWVKPDGPFRDRLQLDKQTGDLKISNIKTTDSGQYKPKISSTRGSPETEFTVNVVSADGVKTVPVEVTVMKGDSVTLRPDLTEIQRDHVIQWRFGQQKSPVADINRFLTSYSPDGRFRDRLKVDNRTGSLTITDITATDSGLYEVEISSSTSSRYTVHHTQSFTVTVRGEMKSVSGTEGKSVTLQIVTKVQNDDLIHWMFRDNVIADIHKANRRFYTSDIPDGKFKGRLDLDRQTGSLIIMNTRTTDSGLYEVKISSSRCTINRRVNVTVTGSGLSPGAVAGIVVGVLLVAAAAAGVIYRRKKQQKRKTIIVEEHPQNPTLLNGNGTELADTS